MANRKVTIRDVAAEANVSMASVSLYLNDKPGLADDTRDRIAAAVSHLGYLPRRSPAVTEPRYIGLLIEKLPLSPLVDMFYGEVIQGIEAYAKEIGYNIALIVVDPEEGVPRLLRDHNGDLVGVVILGSGDIDRNIISAVQEKKLPMVLVDNYLLDVAIDCVLPDYVTGAHQATRYLLDQGYERIAFLQGSGHYISLAERFRGYCSALIESGIGLDPALIRPYLSSGLPNKGYLEMKSLLEDGAPFDAVFCVTDRAAFGALQALQEYGMRVPKDVALIGFDNVAQSSHSSPALTTVNVPKRKMGEVAIHRLCELIGEQTLDIPVKHVLNTSLVIRDSA